MRQLTGGYTQRFNHVHGRSRHAGRAMGRAQLIGEGLGALVLLVHPDVPFGMEPGSNEFEPWHGIPALE